MAILDEALPRNSARAPIPPAQVPAIRLKRFSLVFHPEEVETTEEGNKRFANLQRNSPEFRLAASAASER
jgi:hypothetical protein